MCRFWAFALQHQAAVHYYLVQHWVVRRGNCTRDRTQLNTQAAPALSFSAQKEPLETRALTAPTSPPLPASQQKLPLQSSSHPTLCCRSVLSARADQACAGSSFRSLVRRHGPLCKLNGQPPLRAPAAVPAHRQRHRLPGPVGLLLLWLLWWLGVGVVVVAVGDG